MTGVEAQRPTFRHFFLSAPSGGSPIAIRMRKASEEEGATRAHQSHNTRLTTRRSCYSVGGGRVSLGAVLIKRSQGYPRFNYPLKLMFQEINEDGNI